MAQIEGDFEKGEAGGALDALNVISAAAGRGSNPGVLTPEIAARPNGAAPFLVLQGG